MKPIVLALCFLAMQGVFAQNPKVVRIDPNQVHPPIAIRTPEPIYPKELKKQYGKTTVVLKVVVGSDGLVHNPQVAYSKGEELTKLALENAKSWLFKPATKDGQPVSVLVNLEMNFE